MRTVKKKRVAWNLIVLEKWQKKFIKDNFYKLTNPQIAMAIGLNLTTTRKHCYRMGFKRMELEYWSDTSIRFLRLYYKKIGDTEMSEIFQKHFPKNKPWTKKHIDKKRRYLFLLRTDAEILAIKKRNIEKGRFAICAVKMWETRGCKPIGTVVVWKNARKCTVVFIKTNRGYVLYHRFLWENAYGKLRSSDIIRAKEGAPEICKLEDLEKITREENGIRNKMLPSSIIKTMFKIKDTALARQIAKDYPELVVLKTKMLNLKTKINEHITSK